MAYQNVGGSPRFFIDNYRFLKASGLNIENYSFENEGLFGLDPMRAEQFELNEEIHFYAPLGNFKGVDYSNNMKWYCAILNHDIGENSHIIDSLRYYDSIDGDSESEENPTSVLNFQANSEISDGSTIIFTDLAPTDTREYAGVVLTGEGSVNIGSVSMGVMYTMPTSPDLDISMNIEMSGFDSVQTLGGSEIVNIRNTGNPLWENKGSKINQFGVGSYSDENIGFKRNGRRTWAMKFTHISDSNIFSSNYMENSYVEDDASNYNSDDITENVFNYNVFTDDSFIAQVWNKTLGGALPFIFQPDSTNNNPDQFCIAKFDMDSLSVKQVAFKSYEISLKIREVW